MSQTHQVIEPKAPAPPVAKPASKPSPQAKVDQLPPYHVILLDDDDHSYEYVIDMLKKLFGHSRERGFALAAQVDLTGRAVVFTTHKERAELKCAQVRAYGCDFTIASSKSSMNALIQPAEG